MLKRKTLMVASAAVLALNSSQAFAQSDVNSALQNICTIVKTNDKSELRKKMKKVQSDFRMKLKDYYGSISCDGNSLIRLALLNEAVDTGTLLVKKLPKKELQSPEKDGKTIHTWAVENGMDGSPITSEISGRI